MTGVTSIGRLEPFDRVLGAALDRSTPIFEVALREWASELERASAYDLFEVTGSAQGTRGRVVSTLGTTFASALIRVAVKIGQIEGGCVSSPRVWVVYSMRSVELVRLCHCRVSHG